MSYFNNIYYLLSSNIIQDKHGVRASWRLPDQQDKIKYYDLSVQHEKITKTKCEVPACLAASHVDTNRKVIFRNLHSSIISQFKSLALFPLTENSLLG